MAYSPNQKYPGATNPDPNYKDGIFRDNNPSTTNNGSPLKAIDRNELLARDEAIMNDAGFEYNGLPDTPQDSQLFKAYKASLGNGANLLSNHNFLIPSPDDSQPAPSSTPTSYPPGFQIFSNVFADETVGITNLTYIDGRVSFSGGSFYMPVANTGGIERLTEFAASVADFDGKPRTRGVSFALVGDEYRVTVGVDALEDTGGNDTLLGSVKFQEGKVPDRHDTQAISARNLGDYTDLTFPSVSDMVANASSKGISVGSKLSTGGTHWKVVNTSGVSLGGGLFAIALNGLYVSDEGVSADSTESENVTGINYLLGILVASRSQTLKFMGGAYNFNDGFQLTSSVKFKGDFKTTRFLFSHGGDIACFDIKTNKISFEGFTADVNHTSAPSNGGLGNIIQIGAYAASSAELYNDIQIEDVTLTKSGIYATNTTVVGIYNRCNNVKIKNLTTDGGMSGIIIHWSGDIDPNNPDTSPATITWHPFDIEISKFNARNCLLPLSISGAYDVTANHLVFENCRWGIFVLPGDFTTTKADVTQKDLIGTGLSLSNINCNNIQEEVLRVDGIGSRGVFSTLTQLQLSVKNLYAVAGDSTIANPVLIDKAYGVDIDGLSLVGYDSFDGVTALYSRGLNLKLNKIKANRSVVASGALDTKISGSIEGAGTSKIGVEISNVSETTVTLTSALSKGDTSINVSATTQALYAGEDVTFPNGDVMTIARDDYFPIGSTNLVIEPSITDQLSGTVGDVTTASKGTRINNLDAYRCFYPVRIRKYSENTVIDGLKAKESERQDIEIDGSGGLVKGVTVVNSTFRHSNTDEGGNRPNINANFIDGLKVSLNDFNEVGSDVDARFGVNLGADCSNSNINTNMVYGLETGGAFVFHTTQSVAAAARGKNFIGLNRLTSGLTEVSGSGYQTVTIVDV